jgi:FtsP/CotA-like multicopper oxidase with cupredoxin domain
MHRRVKKNAPSSGLGAETAFFRTSVCLLQRERWMTHVSRPRCGWLSSLVVVLGACSSAGNSAPPTGINAALTPIEDRNPDPNIVEVNLEARMAEVELAPGLRPTMRTYNGSLPGPLIRAKVGDRIIVHFKNSLPDPTTVHWHGVRVPANMDGTPNMEGMPMSQDPVKPGGTFDYDFHVPDASLFWYHAHVDSSVQVGEGLYGPLIVQDPSEPPALGDEVILVLSDVMLNDDGGLYAPLRGDTLASLFGIEGQTILVNGRVRPTLTARAGVRQRWRIVNSAQARFFQLELKGHTFTRIGSDGGLIESPIESDSVVLAPGERADVSVVPNGAPGSDVPLRWIPYDRGFGTAFGQDPKEIMTLHIDNSAPATPSPLPAHLRTIEPLDVKTALPQTVVIDYAKGVDGGAAPEGQGYWVNGEAFQAMLMAKVSETDVLTVDNRTDWDHPFHLHGFFFQPLDESGAPVHEWKDTFNVPVKSTRRMIVRYDDRPGNWMFHCHILDHAEIGLMGMLMLEH